jgi:bacillithiol system protein YtxJ
MLQWLQNLTTRLRTAQPESAAFPEIRTASDFDQLLLHPTPVVIFKHSRTCPVSFAALRQMRAFAASRPEVSIFLLSVLDYRPTSRLVAERLNVQHESPQAIVLQAGAVIAYLSHARITVSELTRVLPLFTAACHDEPVPASSLHSPQL